MTRSGSIEPGGTRGRGLLLLVATALMWGLNWPINKVVVAELPPMTARSFTGVIGCALFIAAAALRRERLLPLPGEWRPLLVSTLLNFTCWMGFSALSLLWLGASEAVILTYTLPIWATLLAWPLLGERPRPAGVVGLILALAGVATLMLDQPLHASWEKLPGAACSLAASTLFALGTVLGKRMPVRLPPLAAVGWQLGLGSLPLIAAALAFDHPHLWLVDAYGWGGVLYNAAIGLGFGYVTWFAALRLLPASTTATGALMVPVAGVLSASLMLGEVIGAREVVALGFTLSGVGLALRK